MSRIQTQYRMPDQHGANALFCTNSIINVYFSVITQMILILDIEFDLYRKKKIDEGTHEF
jgi:hypothetical protein